MRRHLAPILAAAVLLTLAGAEPAGARADTSSATATRTCSGACAHRRHVRAKWRRAVNAYGVGLLRARMNCESGSSGGYRLDTTGNGYWFAHQFDVAAWTGAGGRFRGGRPVGVWRRHPGRLEQDYRAVVWDARHGGDPWPNCP